MIHESKFCQNNFNVIRRQPNSVFVKFTFLLVCFKTALILRRKLRQFGHLFTQRSGAPSVRRSEKAFRCNLCKARFFETEAELDIHHSCHVPNSEGYGVILFVLYFSFFFVCVLEREAGRTKYPSKWGSLR